MSRVFLLLIFCILSGCRNADTTLSSREKPANLGDTFVTNGILGIEFFDPKTTMHMPVAGILVCDAIPCEYLYTIPYLAMYDGKDVSNTVSLNTRNDSLALYEKKLEEYATKLNSLFPEKNSVIVDIAIDSGGNNKDVVGLVMPFLEKYSLHPDTVEVSSLPSDSLTTPTNKGWRLIEDSVKFRHIVDIRILRFVRK